MKSKTLSGLRSVASALLGYMVITILTILGFRPLGNIVHLSAPLRIQVLGTLVAVVAGLCGGLTAALVAGRRPVQHAAAVLLFLTIDTGIVLSRPSPDPWWFDLAGSLTLMAATVSGGVLYHLVTRTLQDHPR